MSGARITVVVSQRESFGHTERSLESLYATAGAPFDLIYIDAGSPAGVRHFIEDAAHRRGFRVIRRQAFITPNEMRNLALASVETDFVAFVENDLIFRDGWLRHLLACADETGADLVGPLIYIGERGFRKIHFAGVNVRVEEGAAGLRLVESHRFLGQNITPEIARQLVREPSEMLELHCMLVRRSIFGRIGPFDEGLRSMNEHLDFCMVVRQSGGVVMFEPDAVVNHLLPRQFPFDLQSLPFLFERWSTSNNVASAEHFRTKWKLAPGDPATEATYNWCNDRRLVIVRWLHPKIAAHALRKLNRILKRCYRQVANRVATQT